jgi:hypothetical protein
MSLVSRGMISLQEDEGNGRLCMHMEADPHELNAGLSGTF